MNRYLFLIFLLILVSACVKEKHDFAPESEVQVIVKNDVGEAVSGADIRIYESETAFLNAINSPGLGSIEGSNVRIETTANGKATFNLQPERPYLLLITYYDSEKKMLFSNLGISSYINPLPSNTTLYVQMKIKPYLGNVLFFTRDASKLPITISLSNKTEADNNLVLDKVYSGDASKPTVTDSNILSFERQPGKYAYNAISSDGCVWTGLLDVALGATTAIEITQCEKAYLNFYSPDAKDEWLPLTVILNEVDTAGQISQRRAEFSCGDDKSNMLSTLRNKGQYNYLVKSKNGSCVWTGTFNAKENECRVIKLERCEL